MILFDFVFCQMFFSVFVCGRASAFLSKVSVCASFRPCSFSQMFYPFISSHTLCFFCIFLLKNLVCFFLFCFLPCFWFPYNFAWCFCVLFSHALAFLCFSLTRVFPWLFLVVFHLFYQLPHCVCLKVLRHSRLFNGRLSLSTIINLMTELFRMYTK